MQMTTPAGKDSSLDDCRTLVDVFKYHVNDHPSRTVYRFLSDGETESGLRNYEELYARAHLIATHLLSHLRPGARAVLLYPSGQDFIEAFLGCLLAGVVAVPSVPPGSKRHIGRLEHSIADSGTTLFLTTSLLDEKFQAWFGSSSCGDLPWLSTDVLDTAVDSVELPDVTADTLAFLQYTSGSTGQPKGVMVDHANLLDNSRLIASSLHHTPATVGVGWLPVYHDMGLIGNILQALYVGFELVLMPPKAFVEKPVRWLRAISTYRATASGSPDFAYGLCADSRQRC